MLVGILDFDFHDVADRQMAGIAQEDLAVDLGSVGTATAGSTAFLVHRVDDDGQGAPDLGGELGGGDGGGLFHDPRVTLFLHLFGDVIGKRIGGGTLDGLEAEGADPVELGFVQPVEEILKSSSVSPGKPTTKVERIAMSGQMSRH